MARPSQICLQNKCDFQKSWFLMSRVYVDLVSGLALMFRERWRVVGIINMSVEHDDIRALPYD